MQTIHSSGNICSMGYFSKSGIASRFINGNLSVAISKNCLEIVPGDRANKLKLPHKFKKI